MSYKTSDVVVGNPFRAKKDRGTWSSPHDFVWACLNNGFRLDSIYGITIVPLIVANGFFPVIVWIGLALLYAIPMFFLQSFLGQFSSSGFISSFRITPLFKGLGYIALIMNLISLAFQSALVAVPLLFLIHSLQPTLPWSCLALRPWSQKIEISNNSSYDDLFLYRSLCDLNRTEIKESGDWLKLLVPSVEFFWHKLGDFNLEIFGCMFVIWAAVAFAVSGKTEKIGIYFRYCTIAVVSLLVIVFIRMLFLPEIWENIGISKVHHDGPHGLLWIIMPIYIAFTMFGPGWGSVLNLASYNKFKTDVVKYSWRIPICQLVLLILFGLLSDISEVHLTKDYKNVIPPFTGLQWIDWVTIPSTLTSMSYPHLWTWMFLIMVVLGCFNLTVIQMFAVQTAIFDEFEQLRKYKKPLIFGTAAILAIISAFICTLNGLKVIEKVINMNIFSQCILYLVLIFVLLWVYGHQRLRRDVEFMTNQVMSSWKFHYFRVLAPVLFALMAFVALFFGINYHHNVLLLCLLVTLLPWLTLPSYCVYRLRQATGSFKSKLSRCNKPTEWYPVDLDDKQRYEESYGNQETTQPLTTITP